MLHEIPLDVVRAPNASKPNEDEKIIGTGSEVSVNCLQLQIISERTFPMVIQRD